MSTPSDGTKHREPGPALRVIRNDGGLAPAPRRRAPVRLAVYESRGDEPSMVVSARPGPLPALPDDLVDLPAPEGPSNDLEAAIHLLRLAAQSPSVSVQGDALLVAIEFATHALADRFDAETARRHLENITRRL